jgi:hypothetical protein
MLKIEMATYLAETEPSVKFGMQTRQYWINAYMGKRKAELERLLDRRTSPEYNNIASRVGAYLV